MSQVEDLLTVLPGEDLRQRVGSSDEVQLRARVLGRDVMQGVDRVSRPTSVDIDPGDREPRVGGRGDHRHEVPVLSRGDLALLLEGLGPGGHEDDLVESEDVLHLTGCDQVPMVDRIKGSTHDADAKRTSRQGHALRLASLLGDTFGSPQPAWTTTVGEHTATACPHCGSPQRHKRVISQGRRDARRHSGCCQATSSRPVRAPPPPAPGRSPRAGPPPVAVPAGRPRDPPLGLAEAPGTQPRPPASARS